MAQRWAKMENGYEINKLAFKIERLWEFAGFTFALTMRNPFYLMMRSQLAYEAAKRCILQITFHVYQVNGERVTFQRNGKKGRKDGVNLGTLLLPLFSLLSIFLDIDNCCFHHIQDLPLSRP
jgi:hypothetical protein